MTYLFLMLLVLVAAGFAENTAHQRRLRRIPIRIHVNGTRGKSTTTRLIAAGLRAGGLRTVAKTTGTEARLIMEDGGEYPLKRLGVPNIIEQVRTAALASRRRADALVLECMALRPENQWVSERRMIKATIGVITNVREDHLDVMGQTLADVARTLSLTIPRGGHLVTAEDRFAADLAERARTLGTVFHQVDGAAKPDESWEGFPYLSFRENVICALRVCELAGVDRAVALQGMRQAAPDPGASRLLRLERAGRPYYLLDALAANDCASTALAWRLFQTAGLPADLPLLAVMCNRADRALRIRELAPFVAGELKPAYVILAAQAGGLARRCLERCGCERSRIRDWTGLRAPARLLEAIVALAPQGAVLFALGNTKGAGRELVEYFSASGASAGAGGAR